MAIDEIGQATKRDNELLQLARDFDLHHFALEPMQEGVPGYPLLREEYSITHGLKVTAHRLIRRSQRKMQPDCDAGFAGIENVEGDRLGAVEARSDYHHGGGIDPSTHDEITDCNVDRRRHAVIIGTQPDMSTHAVTPSIDDIPVFHRGLPVYYRSKPNPDRG